MCNAISIVAGLILATVVASDPPRQKEPDSSVAQVKREMQELQQKQREMEEHLNAAEAAEADETEAVDERRRFLIYGFFDMNFQQWWLPEVGPVRFVDDQHSSFVFGNLNLYFDFSPLPSWRFLSEVRLLLNPTGDIESYESKVFGTSFSRVDTTTTDPSNLGEVLSFGSLEIERAQLDWTGLDWLNLTLGMFLTPYGIWNVDHGSPTRLTAVAPAPYSSYMAAFPERQLGVKLHGSFLLGNIQLGYDLTVSNGRGTADTLKDSNWDKAVGGRLEAGSSGSWRWKAGLSFYTGEVTDSKRIIQLTPSMDLHKEITVQYRELALGADLQIEIGPVGIQWEGMANWRNYDDDHRPPMSMLGSFTSIGGLVPEDLGSFSSGGLTPDRISWGTYLLASYRLPLPGINIRPYALLGWADFDDNIPHENALSVRLGVNWRVSGAIVFKAEYLWGHWPYKEPGDPDIRLSSGDTHFMVLQLAVAF